MASGAELGEGFESNPLAIELGESAADGKDDDGAEPQESTAQPARAKLAKMQREGKDARAQVQKLQIETQQQQVEIQQKQDEVQQLREENEQQQADNQQLQDENQQLEAQVQMDGDAVRQSESALRKEVATLNSPLAAVAQPAGTELATVAGTGDQAVPADSTASQDNRTQEVAMKDLAADESLSEDARETAKKAFEVLLSSQLLDIEQTAALKKLESEAQFVNQQARIELEKQQAEAQVKEQKALFVAQQRSAALQKLQAEAQFMDQKAQAREQLESATKGVSEEMTERLATNRLQDYAAHMALIAGS